jgi:hypothetical protein
MREGRSGVIEAAMALPAMVWLAVSVAMLAAVPFGYRALAAPADLNMAEAAILRDEAEVLRQLRLGVDANAPQSIRPGIFTDDLYTMTPFEAAIAARHLEIITLLAGNGATLDDSNLPRLVCLSRASGASEITQWLEQRSPSPVPADCHDVRLPW